MTQYLCSIVKAVSYVITKILALVFELGAYVTINDLKQSFSLNTAVDVVAHT